MNKKIKLIALLGLVICSLTITSTNAVSIFAQDENGFYVDFFNNYSREDFALSNGFKGKGNNLIYKTVFVQSNSFVSQPENPERANYDFLGWYTEADCQIAWDFNNNPVTSDLRLFAKWSYSQAKEDQEPPYNKPSTVLDNSAPTDYVINSVMNFKIINNIVKLSTSALSKLTANKDDVLPLIEYQVKAGKTITATYENNLITIKCGANVETITVKDDSLNLVVSESTYENKAKNYEKKALQEDSYHVVLAGSSSMENWSTSVEDLSPIVSYNHGIGGTTIEQWTNSLNQRLVYPYKPKMVVYYVGINNVINSKQDANTIWNNLNKFFDDTHSAMPNTQVQYILMNLIPGYTSYFNTINQVNEKAIEYQKNNSSWLTLINPGTALLKDNGQPNAAYFKTDGLHMSYYGYVVWGAIVKESILKGLENL